MLVGLLLICLAAVSWGTTGATMTVLSHRSSAGPLLVGWARMAVAAPALLLAAWLAGRGRGRASALARGSSTRSDAAGCLVLGVAMAAYQLCYFPAVTLTGIAATALLAICSAPIMIALLAAGVLGERLTPRTLVSLAMAVAGTALLVVGPRGVGKISGPFALGVLLALGAGLSYAVYAVTAKRLLVRMAPLAQAAATFTLAAILLSPTLLAEQAIAVPLRAGWLLILYLGLGATAGAYALFTIGLRRVPATVAGIATLLEPLTASVLGVLAFGERLGPLGSAGAALLLAALVILALAGPETA
jgi:DME family drug/metabolite transporter